MRPLRPPESINQCTEHLWPHTTCNIWLSSSFSATAYGRCCPRNVTNQSINQSMDSSARHQSTVYIKCLLYWSCRYGVVRQCAWQGDWPTREHDEITRVAKRKVPGDQLSLVTRNVYHPLMLVEGESDILRENLSSVLSGKRVQSEPWEGNRKCRTDCFICGRDLFEQDDGCEGEIIIIPVVTIIIFPGCRHY